MRKDEPDYEARRALSHATTFREDEVVGMVELFTTLRRGGDPGVMLRSDVLRRIEKKFRNAADGIRSRKVS